MGIRNTKSLLLFATAFLSCSEIVFATNFGFLPGDSCFHTTLSKEFVEKLQLEKDPIFSYVRPKNASRNFCGYGGFFRMQYTDMPAEFKTNLKKVYEEIRTLHRRRMEVYPETVQDEEDGRDIPTGKMIREEINPIHVFFVNADFDLKEFRIGLKYNENWYEQKQQTIKHNPKDVGLDLFVESENAVMMDWRDAKRVRQLDAQSPTLSTKTTNQPVKVTGKLKAIVLPTGKIKGYFLRELPYYVVDETGISWSGGKQRAGGLFQP